MGYGDFSRLVGKFYKLLHMRKNINNMTHNTYYIHNTYTYKGFANSTDLPTDMAVTLLNISGYGDL